jgi:hypothetical protein
VSGINLDTVEQKSSSSGDEISPNINGSFINSPKMGEEEDDDEIKKITKTEIKIMQTLELKGDYYSLAFYGQFLDTDDEELSAHNSAEKKKIKKPKQRKNSKVLMPPTREQQIE